MHIKCGQNPGESLVYKNNLLYNKLMIHGWIFVIRSVQPPLRLHLLKGSRQSDSSWTAGLLRLRLSCFPFAWSRVCVLSAPKPSHPNISSARGRAHGRSRQPGTASPIQLHTPVTNVAPYSKKPQHPSRSEGAFFRSSSEYTP